MISLQQAVQSFKVVGAAAAKGAAAPAFRNAFEWADSLPNLEQRTASVLNVLARYAYTSDVCWPSISAIAAATRMDRETVARHLAILVAAGHITDTGERTGQRRNVTKWRLCWRDSTAPRACAGYTDDVQHAAAPASLQVAPPQAARPITVASSVTVPSIVMPAVAADADALVWPDLDLELITTTAAEAAEAAEVAEVAEVATVEEVAAIPSPADALALEVVPAVDNTSSTLNSAKPVDKSGGVKVAVRAPVGMPVLPSPAPVPDAVRARLERIRAEAAGRRQIH